MNTLTQLRDAQKQLRRLRRAWVDDHPGLLARIANQLECSSAMVSDVLHDKRTSSTGDIERLLAKHGAPGFEEESAAA